MPLQSTTTSMATTYQPSSRIEAEEDEGTIEKRSSSPSIHIARGSFANGDEEVTDRLGRPRKVTEMTRLQAVIVLVLAERNK